MTLLADLRDFAKRRRRRWGQDDHWQIISDGLIRHKSYAMTRLRYLPYLEPAVALSSRRHKIEVN